MKTSRIDDWICLLQWILTFGQRCLSKGNKSMNLYIYTYHKCAERYVDHSLVMRQSQIGNFWLLKFLFYKFLYILFLGRPPCYNKKSILGHGEKRLGNSVLPGPNKLQTNSPFLGKTRNRLLYYYIHDRETIWILRIDERLLSMRRRFCRQAGETKRIMTKREISHGVSRCS